VSKRKPASTKDVLGVPVAVRPIASKWRKHYSRLEQLRSMLLNKRQELTADARQEVPNFSMHMADAGTDTYDRDWALGMLSSEQDAVYEIDQAIDRIRNGTYGICEMTGKRIEPDRLEAIPWTRFSLEAERELEQNGTAHRTRLGERGSVAGVAQSAERDAGVEDEESAEEMSSPESEK